MCSSCMCVLNMCFAACSGLGDTHPPIRLETTYACGIINSSSTASLCWICTQLINFRIHWEFSIWASVCFLLDSSRLQILSVNSIWTACEFNNRMEISQNSIWTACEFNNRMEISQNAETFNHLALLTMLSALRHGWGMLALSCGEIERYFMKLDSQPTLVLPNIRNKNRATVADDRARCDTPKNLCIVLILPLAALRITYGKRISSDACLYTALKWNNCSQ